MQNGSKLQSRRRSRASPKFEQVLAFTRKLVRGLATGMPLLACLRHILEHECSPVMRDLERDCIESIAGGQTFSEALGMWRESVKEGETMTAILEPLGFGPTPCCARLELPDDPESFANQLRPFADDLDQEVQISLTTLQTVAGPILTVVLMVLVASLVVMVGNL